MPKGVRSVGRRSGSAGSLLPTAGSFVWFGAFAGTWAVAAVDVERTFHLSDAALGALIAVAVIAAAAVNAVGGVLTDRWGAGVALARALVLWGVLLAAEAASPRFALFAIAFVLATAGGGLVDVVINILAAARLGARPGHLVRFHGLFNAGAVLGAAMTGLALHAGASWRVAWAVIAVGRGPARLGQLPLPRGRDTGDRAPFDGAVAARAAPRRSDPLRRGVRGGRDGGRWHRDVGRPLPPRRSRRGRPCRRRRVRDRSVALDRHAHGRWSHDRRARCRAASHSAARSRPSASVSRRSPRNAAAAAAGLALASVGITVVWPLLLAEVSVGARHPSVAIGGVTAAGYLGMVAGPAIVGALSGLFDLRVGLLVLAGAALFVTFVPTRVGGSASDDVRGRNGSLRGCRCSRLGRTSSLPPPARPRR